MKKKIIIGIVILLIIGVAVAAVVVMKANNESDDSDKKSKKETSENISDKNEVTQEKVDKEGMRILEVKKAFDKGIAIVVGENGNEYAIKENGEVISDLSNTAKNTDDVKLVNGFVVIPQTLDDKAVVYNNSGDIIYEIELKGNVGKRLAGVVTEDENVLIYNPDGSYSFETKDEKVVVEKVDELSVYEYSMDDDTNYLVDDYFMIGRIIFDFSDVKNIKTLDMEDSASSVTAKGKVAYITTYGTDYIVDLDNMKKYEAESAGLGKQYDITLLNDKYYYRDCKNYAQEKEIVDLKGNVVKDLTDIGVASSSTPQIIYYDNVYYIMTEDLELMTLDENFEEILKPTNTDDLDGLGANTIYETYKGVVVKNVIIDKNGEVSEDFTDKVKDIDGYISKAGDKFIYYSDGTIFNIKENKVLEIYK